MQKSMVKKNKDATDPVRFEDLVVTRLISGENTAEAVRRAIDEAPESYRDYIIRSCREVD